MKPWVGGNKYGKWKKCFFANNKQLWACVVWMVHYDLWLVILTLTVKVLCIQVALIIEMWMQNMNLIFTFTVLLLQEVFHLTKFFLFDYWKATYEGNTAYSLQKCITKVHFNTKIFPWNWVMHIMWRVPTAKR